MGPNYSGGPRYVAFMADVIGSRDVADPPAFQERFVQAVSAAAEVGRDASPLKVPVEVTGGDEAKGLYRSFGQAWQSFLAIQAAIHPERLRVGFGLGTLLSGVPEADARIGALNGDCLVRARKAIEATGRHQPVRVEAGAAAHQDVAENTLSLSLLVRHDWKQKQAQYAYAFGRAQGVGAIAQRFGVSDATVSESLTSSMAHAVHNAEAGACSFVDRLLDPAESA